MPAPPASISVRAARLLDVEPAEVRFEWREWRWVALLPHHVVFAAPGAPAWERLAREAAILARLERESVPRVLSSERRVQVRSRLEGIGGHDLERLVFGCAALPTAAERYRADCPLSHAGARLADELGAALGRLHGAIGVAEARAMGVPEAPFLESLDLAADVIAAHAGSLLLDRAAARGRAWCRSRRADLVFCHGDLILHNVIADPRTGRLVGLIDFGDMCIADRTSDLRYLHSSGLPFARRALAAYVAASGRPIDLDAVPRYQVLAALEHFAFVPPHAPRFPEIIAWATDAVRALAPDWGSP